MSSFNQKQYKKRRSMLHTALAVGAVIVGVLIVWFIAQRILNKSIDHVPLASATTIYDTFLPKRTLVKRINELQTTLESYDAALTTAKLLAVENDALKAELGRTPAPTGILAHVITLPNRSFYDTFAIDAGAAEGIKVGQTVYGFGSIALGTISAAEEHHATVYLFSASGRTSSGTVMGSDVAVALIGRGGGEYEVRMPRDVEFTVGGLIAYQSVSTAVLAEIERIVTDPRDPFQRLLAKAPINLQALKWVIVR